MRFCEFWSMTPDQVLALPIGLKREFVKRQNEVIRQRNKTRR